MSNAIKQTRHTKTLIYCEKERIYENKSAHYINYIDTVSASTTIFFFVYNIITS